MPVGMRLEPSKVEITLAELYSESGTSKQQHKHYTSQSGISLVMNPAARTARSGFTVIMCKMATTECHPPTSSAKWWNLHVMLPNCSPYSYSTKRASRDQDSRQSCIRCSYIACSVAMGT